MAGGSNRLIHQMKTATYLLDNDDIDVVNRLRNSLFQSVHGLTPIG